MKSIKNSQINTISFIKLRGMSTSGLVITLKKTIGSKTYTFYDLEDIGSQQPLNEFIVLPMDLLLTPVVGGEYVLNLSDDIGNDYGNYICNVIDYNNENSTSTNDLFSSTIKVSNL